MSQTSFVLHAFLRSEAGNWWRLWSVSSGLLAWWAAGRCGGSQPSLRWNAKKPEPGLWYPCSETVFYMILTIMAAANLCQDFRGSTDSTYFLP